MKRILFLIAVLAGTHPAFVPRLEAVHVTLDYVAERAEARARKPFHSPRADLPAVLSRLTYDQYREIEFRHDKALWAEEGLPFRVEFFHLGYLYQEPVHFNEFSLTHTQPVRFAPDFFDYRSLRLPSEIPANTGYAGFRVLNPLNEPGKWDELGAFQGASYFRLLGQGQVYGMSARGLALDCGEDGRPEEFPLFTDWWLGKPQHGDDELLLYAILDSVSCTGAYEFHIHPGAATVAEVEAVLYFREQANILAADPQRKPLATIGYAPLTSMFWFGSASEWKFDDYRPEVHDSDGLLMHMDGGEMVWRPLAIGSALRHQIFPAANVRGFGLLQRDRNFDHYQDVFHAYENVPSVWVTPHGKWGNGEVHLVELSTQYEGMDNVVAFWNPAGKPAPLQPLRFGYTLSWTRETETALSSNEVVATRVGLNPRAQEQRQFVIDFDLPKLTNDPPTVAASCGDNGTITESQIYRNKADKTWRVFLNLLPKPGQHQPVDLKCALKKGDDTVSETWSYHWSPP
jgi:periplasmic glucans biosynthesis protein